MANEYLQRTPTSTGNRTKWTISAWSKLNSNTTTAILQAVTGYAIGNYTTHINLANSFSFRHNQIQTAALQRVDTTRILRDVGSWYHYFISYDSSLEQQTDRLKIYVNGSLVPFDESQTITLLKILLEIMFH